LAASGSGGKLRPVGHLPDSGFLTTA
jgi:hypothetical protein